MTDHDAWLSAIAHHPGIPGSVFKMAWWMARKLDDAGHLNLSDFERDNLGPRRTAQRALAVLEWAGYVQVHRRVKGGPGFYGTNKYTLHMPTRQRKVA
jgi:hypothetical protein